VPASAYYVPTREATLTAAAARGLQGLGCAPGCGCGPKNRLSWYLPGVSSPALLSGLGEGAGGGRFNRSVSRGMYRLPFVGAAGQGGAGLGQLAADPTLLLGGIALLALAMFLFGSKHGPRIHKRRVARLRRKLSRLEAYG